MDWVVDDVQPPFFPNFPLNFLCGPHHSLHFSKCFSVSQWNSAFMTFVNVELQPCLNFIETARESWHISWEHSSKLIVNGVSFSFCFARTDSKPPDRYRQQLWCCFVLPHRVRRTSSSVRCAQDCRPFSGIWWAMRLHFEQVKPYSAWAHAHALISFTGVPTVIHTFLDMCTWE